MWESNGTIRTIGALISAIGGLVQAVPLPNVSVWGNLIMQIGAAIGGAGVLNAVSKGTLFSK